jgi:transcriptional regulator with PAS, ATPase and Fis domain
VWLEEVSVLSVRMRDLPPLPVEPQVVVDSFLNVLRRRLSGARLHDKNFTFYGAIQDFEATIIKQALEEAGGSVTRAAKLLGLKHQSLITMLNTRHRQLLTKRKPPEKRLRSIIKELK